MKILVVGSGGREHALAWKIAASSLVDKLYFAPGNPGVGGIAECVNIAAEDIAGMVRFAREQKIDLAVIGPETPLVMGIVDAFEASGLKAFGPSAKGAEIEGSKVFAKKLMYRHAIPTATFRVFDNAAEAHKYVDATPGPLVVKADGLAAGKGVIVTSSPEEAHQGVDLIMTEKQFGKAGERIIIEERLTGPEASILAFTDGRTIVPLLSSQDHKRLRDGDRGPNTGGMGAYAPAPLITPALAREIDRKVLIPLVHALNRDQRPYRGVIYAGMMMTPSGPSVLEFNCRFGDPETQPIMMMLKSDIVPVLMATVEQKLDDISLEWEQGAAVCVVMASSGYPGKYEKGKPISGLELKKGTGSVAVFHAGTTLQDGKVVSNGGRVLGVTARGADIAAARQAAYEAVRKIGFEGAYYRKDIAARAFA
jgi:phosphoribosylamine---glycine ligase